MALTEEEIQAAFDEEAGAAASLASDPEVRRWFNEGAARLGRYEAKSAALTWASGDTEVALPADLDSVSKIDYGLGVAAQPFRVFGKLLLIDCPDGASSAGTARLYYWGARPQLGPAETSPMSDAEDYACLYYALHRFFRKLTSNRVQYVRYSTLLGQNAVSVADLQAESDRLYQDYIDARADLPLQQAPSGYYEG